MHKAGATGCPTPRKPRGSVGSLASKASPASMGVPAHERLFHLAAARSKRREEMHKVSAEQRRQVEEREATFSPAIGASQKGCLGVGRVKEDPYGHKILSKIECMRDARERELLDPCTFKPEVDQRSEAIFGARIARMNITGPLHEALYEDALRRQSKMSRAEPASGIHGTSVRSLAFDDLSPRLAHSSSTPVGRLQAMRARALSKERIQAQRSRSTSRERAPAVRRVRSLGVGAAPLRTAAAATPRRGGAAALLSAGAAAAAKDRAASPRAATFAETPVMTAAWDSAHRAGMTPCGSEAAAVRTPRQEPRRAALFPPSSAPPKQDHASPWPSGGSVQWYGETPCLTLNLS
mmetsp:Transcript_42018/g.124674  ORF Transcript_42018/g.124674 Transcript_42018/m.124674 type:complete len:351 (+) Transcript_42018:2-1054(+)